MNKSYKVVTALEKLDIGGDSLWNLAIENGNPICVRNIEGHIAPQHTVLGQSITVKDCLIQVQKEHLIIAWMPKTIFNGLS